MLPSPISAAAARTRACGPRYMLRPGRCRQRREGAAMNALNLSRRSFLKVSVAAGGAMCLELAVPPLVRGQSPAAETEVNAWVVIRPDDTVVIRVARSEMGQGSSTGL